MPTLVRDNDTIQLYTNFGGCSNVCFDNSLGFFSLDNDVTVDCINVCQDITINGTLCLNSDLDLGSNKILFSNVYSQYNDLPNASTYHGMFAHVHGTGKGYFAHAGQWHCLLDASSSSTSELSEGSNLYFTNTRARQSLCGTGDVTYNCTTGEITATTYKTADFNTDFATKKTCDLTPHYYATEGDLPSAGTYHGAFFHVHGTQKAYFAHGGSWHKLLDESSSTTNDLTEGSTNKYFTEARSRSSICQGTGVTYNCTTGEISIGQPVATTNDVTFNDVVVSGNLTVNGTTTSVTSCIVNIGDINLLLACGANNAGEADGGGITIGGADACFYYDSTGDVWKANKNICANIIGTASDISNHFTCDLTECVNLYFTDTRARQSFCGTGDVTYTCGTGEINVVTYKTADFDTDFATKGIGDLSNVNLTGLQNNQVLAYNLGAQEFRPVNQASGGGGGGTTVCDIVFTLCENDFIIPETFTASGSTSCFSVCNDYHQFSSLVYLNSIFQRPNCDYTICNCVINFTSTPSAGDTVYARAFNRFEIPDGSITLQKIAQGSFVVDCYTGNGSNCLFQLSKDPGNASHMQVAVGGLMQRPDASYCLTHNGGNAFLTFGAPPDNNVDIEVYLNRLVTPIVGITNENLNLTYTSDQYTGNNSETCYSIECGHNIHSVLVFLDGCLTKPNTYSITGCTLQFANAPATSQEIDIRYMPV